jgi:hypothetical protein
MPPPLSTEKARFRSGIAAKSTSLKATRTCATRTLFARAQLSALFALPSSSVVSMPPRLPSTAGWKSISTSAVVDESARGKLRTIVTGLRAGQVERWRLAVQRGASLIPAATAACADFIARSLQSQTDIYRQAGNPGLARLGLRGSRALIRFWRHSDDVRLSCVTAFDKRSISS